MSPAAHTCPRCGGDKRVADARLGGFVPCPTCDATGVVWSSDGPQEAAAGGASPLELNGL